MTDSSSDEFDPTAPDQREIGREMVDDSTGLGSVMAHAYRGEIDRDGDVAAAPRRDDEVGGDADGSDLDVGIFEYR